MDKFKVTIVQNANTIIATCDKADTKPSVVLAPGTYSLVVHNPPNTNPTVRFGAKVIQQNQSGDYDLTITGSSGHGTIKVVCDDQERSFSYSVGEVTTKPGQVSVVVASIHEVTS